MVLDNGFTWDYVRSMNLNEKNIFLIDGIGAAFSAFSTGLVLPIFSEWVGLTTGIMYSLATIGLVFSVYSLCCYKLVNRTKPLMLLVIICANLFYCVVAGVIVFAFDGLTLVGRAYFIVETFIILGVIFVEVRVYRKVFGPSARQTLA